MRLYRKCLQQVQSKLNFVPKGKQVSPREVAQLQQFITASERLLVMTGAGLSTESGIPDYRSEGVGLYARTDRRPMSYQDFVKSHQNRQRYWARNYVGWPAFSSFQPNAAHRALSELEQKGFVKWLVTQNVDALHTKAGSKNVTELHGCSHRVVCLNCPKILSRRELQEIFTDINPDFRETSVEIAPDGDVQLTEDQVKGFKVPDCPNCGGVLKPDVIFFGDNVPVAKVKQVYDFVNDCDSILIAGSSLQVYSGFRFVKRAFDQRKQIAMLNIGPTRADKLLNLKIEGHCGVVLSSIDFNDSCL